MEKFKKYLISILVLFVIFVFFLSIAAAFIALTFNIATRIYELALTVAENIVEIVTFLVIGISYCALFVLAHGIFEASKHKIVTIVSGAVLLIMSLGPLLLFSYFLWGVFSGGPIEPCVTPNCRYD